MIKATVNKGDVSCSIEGSGAQILLELTVLVDSVLDKIADGDKAAKEEIVVLFCKGVNYLKEKEN